MTTGKCAHRDSRQLWMRAVPFVALRDLIGLVREDAAGLRARDMVRLAQKEQRLVTQQGRIPSATTLYHYRTVLFNLGVLLRFQDRYVLNESDASVRDLLAVISPGTQTLSSDERLSFARVVIANSDCRQVFFDLFMPGRPKGYDLDQFMSDGQRVAWKNHIGPDGRRVLVHNLDTSRDERWLCAEEEIQAILYGVRYWARNELGFLDEVFLEDVGGVMFPVNSEGVIPDPAIILALLQAVGTDQDWTTLSIRDIAFEWGPHYRAPLRRIFQTLQMVQRQYPEYVVLIPTAEAFATMTASSPGAETYQLRSYLQDDQGRYISHLRIHRKLKEAWL